MQQILELFTTSRCGDALRIVNVEIHTFISGGYYLALS